MVSSCLYIIQMAVTGDFKVGRSRNVGRRLRQLQTGCPYKLRILLAAPEKGHLEREVHRHMRAHKTRHARTEWFREESLGDLPLAIYELIPESVLEDGDWWKDGC